MTQRSERALFLIGFMGCGKTTVGAIVAERLGWRFADTDALVEAREQRSIERIFHESGEGHFREAEWRALQSICDVARIVVATGGGLYLGRVQRGLMRAAGTTMWLDAALPIVRARLAASTGRPLWGTGDPLAQRAFFEKRRAIYALADARIDAGTGSPDEVAARVIARFLPLFH